MNDRAEGMWISAHPRFQVLERDSGMLELPGLLPDFGFHA